MNIYFDYNATAPLRPEARDAMVAALGPPANPSSVHGFGQDARFKVETARRQVAALCGAMPEEVIFTSGGTEANAMALLRRAPSVITSAVEHVAVLDCAPEARRIAVHGDGSIDGDDLARACADAPEGSVVSVMAANNETGVIQPLDDVIRIARDHGHLVHSDAVQGLGKLSLDFAASGLDLMSVSGHKIGGPTGIGALIQREGLASHPRTHGGGQEKNRRPGTENLTGIVGFGAAAQAVMAEGDIMPRLHALHRDFEARIKAEAPDAHVFGNGCPRLGNTTAITMPGKTAETQIMAFDLAGISISAGAACSSGKVKTSHVLMAMGEAERADFTVRISSGWASTEAEFDRLAETWLKLYKQA
ncbi:MAG: cysteine desulfurase [Alphaproteobacteria bacterium]|nr:cysteine desulfurase [Alphaproteobacteria bacterium]